MNSNPEIGSTWKGRILIKVTAYKTDKPLCTKRLLSLNDTKDAVDYCSLIKEYVVIAEVG